MDRRRLLALALVALAVSVTGVVVVAPEFIERGGDYDRTTVTFVADNGTALGTAYVRVADSYQKRYTGLSNTESLGPNEGMLFVHDREQQLAYVMRDMAFPIDIVFVAANGTITEIHHAELPPEGSSGGELKRYRGVGRYVVELPYGWTNETGVDEGDRIRVASDEIRVANRSGA